jgi:hypothetical protein
VTFKKGNKGRPVGALNKLPAEAKDVLARAYTELGGFERFMQWIESEPEHLAHFYTKMWIKLLPMNIRVDSTKTSSTNPTTKSASHLLITAFRSTQSRS